MEASYKFIQKLWLLHKKFMNKIQLNQKNGDDNQKLETYINELIFKVTQNIENFKYNVVIANFYEMYALFNNELEKDIDSNILGEIYLKLLNLLSPFIPHFASECLAELSKYKTIKNNWPKTISKFLDNKKISLVVQVNGKKKEILNVNRDMKEDEIMELINKNDKLRSIIQSKKIQRKIYIPNRIINMIVK